jgi:FkbM family methyltransferase
MNRALFRHGTSDANVWESVVDRNEYRLPDKFEPNSLVLDIGANIGSFSYACIQRGAAKVIAFEPDPDNFALFRKQLKSEIFNGLVEIYPLAVVGGSGFSWRTFSGVVRSDGQINHGGAFLFSEEGSDYGLGEFIMNRPFQVPCIGLDEIVLPDGMNFRTLKIDAEGAEWEILSSSTQPTLFESIVGEYHPHKGCNREYLSTLFSVCNYEAEIVPHPNSELGLFFAARK